MKEHVGEVELLQEEPAPVVVHFVNVEPPAGMAVTDTAALTATGPAGVPLNVPEPTPAEASVRVYAGAYVAVIPVLPAGITAVQVAATPTPPPVLTHPFDVPVDDRTTMFPATPEALIRREVP